MRPKEMSSFWKSLDTSEITELNRVFLTGIRDDEDLMKRDHQDRNGVRRNTKVKHTVKHAVKHKSETRMRLDMIRDVLYVSSEQ